MTQSLPELFGTTEIVDGVRLDVFPDGTSDDTESKMPGVLEKMNHSTNQSVASSIFVRMAQIQNSVAAKEDQEADPLPHDWIWADIPEQIVNRLAQWRDMLVNAIPNAMPVTDLHITLFHELLNLSGDLRQIIATTANAIPAEAMLNTIIAFRTESNGIAIAVEVISPQLVELRHKLQDAIEHTPSIHGKYQPHITVAYIPDGEGISMNGLQLYGIAGEKFIIDSLCAGTKLSHQSCAMLGANGAWISRFQPTPRSEEPMVTSETTKAAGMSTLTGETGGFLMQREYSDPWDDDDDDDEQWIRRSQEMADSLDDVFGDY